MADLVQSDWGPAGGGSGSWGAWPGGCGTLPKWSPPWRPGGWRTLRTGRGVPHPHLGGTATWKQKVSAVTALELWSIQFFWFTLVWLWEGLVMLLKCTKYKWADFILYSYLFTFVETYKQENSDSFYLKYIDFICHIIEIAPINVLYGGSFHSAK